MLENILKHANWVTGPTFSATLALQNIIEMLPELVSFVGTFWEATYFSYSSVLNCREGDNKGGFSASPKTHWRRGVTTKIVGWWKGRLSLIGEGKQ